MRRRRAERAVSKRRSAAAHSIHIPQSIHFCLYFTALWGRCSRRPRKKLTGLKRPDRSGSSAFPISKMMTPLRLGEHFSYDAAHSWVCHKDSSLVVRFPKDFKEVYDAASDYGRHNTIVMPVARFVAHITKSVEGEQSVCGLQRIGVSLMLLKPDENAGKVIMNYGIAAETSRELDLREFPEAAFCEFGATYIDEALKKIKVSNPSLYETLTA